ncbi:MAG: hypothetical protein KJ592_00420 [Nanoarchaeota archaeon]|nr:hypothetical protein [Nanoarchaeota archaeon]
MDNKLKHLLEQEYDAVLTKKIREASDPVNKLYPDIKQLQNSIREIGFQEEIIITLQYKHNYYEATIYTKKD